MALIKCHECRKDVSSQAKLCPHCGAPVKKKSGCGMLLVVLILIIIAPGIFSSFTDGAATPTPSKPSPAAVPATKYSGYEDLKRKFESNIAEKYRALLAAQASGNSGEVSRLVTQFKNFKRLDYENVAAIAREVSLKELNERLARTTDVDARARSEIYAELAQLEPGNLEHAAKAEKYAAAWKSEQEAREAADKKAAAEKVRNERRNANIKAQFSAWDGSHRELERVIKKTMNDPDSYKHVETVYAEGSDGILVKTTFRGKNAFGGVVTNWVRAKFSYSGDLIAIVDQGP